MSDFVKLVQSDVFVPADAVQFDQLKTRRGQWLPILPLFARRLPVLLKSRKKTRDAGLTKLLPSYLFSFFSMLDILARDIRVPELRAKWTNHGLVRPIAQGLHDGKLIRSSPQFTFAFICVGKDEYRLGDTVFAHTEDQPPVEVLCKIVSIFMYTPEADGDGDAPLQSRAVYVQLYQPLSKLDARAPTDPQRVDASGDIGCLGDARQGSVGAQELVLTDKQVLLAGEALLFIRHRIFLTEDVNKLVRNLPNAYLCRYALEGKVCFFSSIPPHPHEHVNALTTHSKACSLMHLC